MSKRLHGQSQQGADYTALLRTQLHKRTKGLTGPMGVSGWKVYPVLEVGDWRPIRGKYK